MRILCTELKGSHVLFHFINQIICFFIFPSPFLNLILLTNFQLFWFNLALFSFKTFMTSAPSVTFKTSKSVYSFVLLVPLKPYGTLGSSLVFCVLCLIDNKRMEERGKKERCACMCACACVLVECAECMVKVEVYSKRSAGRKVRKL